MPEDRLSDYGNTHEDRMSDYRNTHVEKKVDYTAVAIAFIKYAAYVVIFFGFLYFIVRYILPFFR